MSTTQQPAPPVERTIHGKLTGVEMRNAGWHRFAILEPGNQYPYRADTKKKELIDQAMSLMNQDVTIQVQERESENINEHTGEPFVNKYLNAIAAQGAVQQSVADAGGQAYQGAGQEATTDPRNVVQPGVSGFDKDLTIWRQTAAKVVGSIYASLPPEQQSVKGVVEASEALVAYFIYGPARFGVQAFSGDGGLGPMLDGPEARQAVAQMQEASEMEHGAKDEACPDCGFVGTHALGCPQADFAA